uniref:UBIQUITIN_CONJUGAT_2 domain-containing protein n=1 Tax=Trichuris muris TaxID=70415 RepID=A0A5S6Q7X2_TRIMR
MTLQIARRMLAQEMKGLTEEPMEGFRVKLIDEQDLFEWDVVLFGPPGTIYEGGYLKALLQFPVNYPFSPPTMRFTTKLWHPNIYESGEVCISILHPPVDDPQSGELPCERWNPAQTVRTILLSVISLLNEPNTNSPANVEASVMYRRYLEGLDDEYVDIVRRIVRLTAADAARDGVVVPTTIEDYCVKEKKAANSKEDHSYAMDFCWWRSNDEFSDDEEDESGNGVDDEEMDDGKQSFVEKQAEKAAETEEQASVNQ